MMLTDLATVARDAGLDVVEVPGWRGRARHGKGLTRVNTIVCHHTAGPSQERARGRDYPSLAVVRDGRPDLPGPLAQLGVGYSGKIYTIAAGIANHTGRTHQRGDSNPYAIGIEAEHPGAGPWPPAQYEAYVRLVAALCRHYQVPVAQVKGHKEIAAPTGRKNDPSFDMARFRADVKTVLDGTHPQSPTLKGGGKEDDDMIRFGDQGASVRVLQRLTNGVNARTARLGAEPVPEIQVDGQFGPATAAALAHAIPRAQGVVGVEFAREDWSDRDVSQPIVTLLFMAVARLGDQLSAKAG